MNVLAYLTVFELAFIQLSKCDDLPVEEDAFSSVDLNFPSDLDEQFSLFQSKIVDLNVMPGSDREQASTYLDETAFSPPKHHRKSNGRHKVKEERFDPEFSIQHQGAAPGVKEESVKPDVPMTPVDVRSIIWKPDSISKVKRCERGSMRGDVNIFWNETACITCECKLSTVQCKRPECAPLECGNQIQPDGECCPRCPEKLCETEDGRRFKHGQEWHMGDCTFCECHKGKVLCSIEDCQVPNCNNPVKIPGRCCPICLDAACHTSNGTTIKAGEVWKEGICTHCYCAGGEVKCAKEKCPFINCTERHRAPGKCCERCNSGVIDCIASDWGSWSECPIQECGGGMRRRFRSVVIPPRNGGSFCPHMSEAQLCPRLPCDVLPVCPVTEWTSWGHCTATCGSGRRMRHRSRDPKTKATMTSLIDCSKTSFQDITNCYAGACMKPDDIAGQDREMTFHEDICFEVTWSEWGPCSAKCGTGVQRRHEVLINAFQPRGHLCRLLDATRKCQGRDCAASGSAATRCRVSPWGDWTPCSKTCGSGGTRTKYRAVLSEAVGNGRPCPKLYVSKPCKTKPCQSRTGSVCLTENGDIYHEGERWSDGPCASCRCVNSQVECPKTACGR